jgi:hypothetical protein
VTEPFPGASEAAREILRQISDVLEGLQLRAALIGGQAVNCWVEPQLTVDVDITIAARGDAVRNAVGTLLEGGFRIRRQQDPGRASGPDFVQLVAEQGGLGVDIQVAKTPFEDGLLERAVPRPHTMLPVATPEDLVVMKLIAWRSKDIRHLVSLAALPDLDWPYIEQWAAVWQVEDRLAQLRERMAHTDSGLP